MNRTQRDQNRNTASKLHWDSHTCPECGERGRHWVQPPASLQDVLDGTVPAGFYTCDKFYGPDGRRIGA